MLDLASHRASGCPKIPRRVELQTPDRNEPNREIPFQEANEEWLYGSASIT